MGAPAGLLQAEDAFLNHAAYADKLSELGLGEMKVEGYRWPPRIQTAFDLWEAVLESADGRESVFITGTTGWWGSGRRGPESGSDDRDCRAGNRKLTRLNAVYIITENRF